MIGTTNAASIPSTASNDISILKGNVSALQTKTEVLNKPDPYSFSVTNSLIDETWVAGVNYPIIIKGTLILKGWLETPTASIRSTPHRLGIVAYRNNVKILEIPDYKAVLTYDQDLFVALAATSRGIPYRFVVCCDGSTLQVGDVVGLIVYREGVGNVLSNPSGNVLYDANGIQKWGVITAAL